MADRAPGARSGYGVVIYNNMIVMTPMFVLFCVVVLLVVPQQMNGLPCLSKIPYLKVEQNPVSPFKHRGLIRTFCCALCSYLSCEVSIMLHVIGGCISRRQNTLWTEWQRKRDKPAPSSVIGILICTGFHFSNLYWQQCFMVCTCVIPFHTVIFSRKAFFYCIFSW